MKHIGIFFAVLLILTMLSSSVFATTWWDYNWQYRQPITMQTSKIGLSADINNTHVILIDVNSTNTSFWNSIQKPTTYDINNYTWSPLGSDLNNQLAGYWKLDETSGTVVTDLRGKNDGNNVGNVPINKPGKVNKSYGDFLSNGYIDLHVAPVGLNISYNTPYSICFWINPTTTTGYLWQHYGGTTGNYEPNMFFNTNKIYWEQVKKGGSGGANDAISNLAIPTAQWTFVCGTFTGDTSANGLKLYINGIPQIVQSTYSIGSAPDSTGIMVFGNSGGNPAADYFPGKMDEIGYWNRSLSSADVLSLYNSYVGGGDIRFVNKDNNAKYNWHYEDLNFDTNRLLAWAGINNIFPSATDLNLYVYYGNSRAFTDINSIATYPSGYISAYHLNNTSDAKGTNNAVSSGGIVNLPGKIGNDTNFTPTSWINIGTGNSTLQLAYTNPITICGWFYPKTNSGQILGQNASANNYYYAFYNQAGSIQFQAGKSGVGNDNAQSDAALPLNTWTNVCGTYTGTSAANGINLYINSAIQSSPGTYSFGALTAADGENDIGNFGPGHTTGWIGQQDEYKYFNYVLNNNEVKLLYNSENDLNFVLFGAQDTNVVPTHYLINFNVYSATTALNQSNINVDCNGTAYDLNNQTSPFSIDMNVGTYICSFSKTLFDTNTLLINSDANKTVTIYLKKSNWWDLSWQYRQPIILKTSFIGLSGNVTNDHAMLIDINSTNTNFWNNINRPYSYNGTNGIWATLDTNLINYYKFDEAAGSLIDYKGFDNNGTNYNITYSIPGKIKTSYTYNNTTSETDINNLVDLNKAEYSLSLWINPNGAGTNRDILYMFADASNEQNLFIDSSNNVFWNYYQGGSYQAQISCGPAPAGNWTFVVITAKANEFKCYLNAGSPVIDSIGSIITVPYVSGIMGSALTGRTNSTVDEMAQWNKVLSASEITSLYNSYVGGGDIRFVNSDNNVKYNWHYEDLNFDTNKILAWVGIPDTYPSASDLNIYVYYGNTSAISDQNIYATYPSTYTNVWHFNEKSGVTANNGILGSPNMTMDAATYWATGGKINSGIILNGLSDFGTTTWSYPATGSVVVWEKSSDVTHGGNLFSNYIGATSGVQFGAFTTPYFYYHAQGAGINASANSNNIWYMIGADFNSAGNTLYKNAVDQGSYIGGGQITNASSTYLGKQVSGNFFLGNIDELKTFNYILSKDEFKLLNYDENINSQFVYFGPQDSNTVTTDTNKTITFNVLLAGGGTGTLTDSQMALAPNLTCRWKFDDTNNTATDTNNICGSLNFSTPLNQQTGKNLYAFNLNGTAYKTFTNPDATTNDKTMMLWAKNLDNNVRIMSMQSSGRTWALYRNGGAVLKQCDGTNEVLLPDTNDSSWHLYAAVWTGGFLNIYVDGVYKGQAADTGAGCGAASCAMLGNGYMDSGCNFSGTGTNGTVDDARIYTTALSQSAILQEYNNGNVTHLTNVNMTCDVNSLNLYDQNSPFTSTTSTNTAATCTFSKSGYDNNIQSFIYDTNKTLTMYLTPTQNRVTFNVYENGTSYNLSNITADWNVNAYDVSGQNSPFTQDVNHGTYLVTFSAPGYDTNANVLIAIDSNKTYNIYLNLSPVPIFKIDFNVYRAGTSTFLNHVDMDCNNNIYDLNNQQSPFSRDMNQNYVYSCGFLIQQGYDRNTQTIIVDMNKTVVVYLTDTNAPATTITANSGSFTTWNASDGNLSLSCTDLNGSGCAQTQYSLDGGAWTTYTPYLLITTDGNHSVDYNSSDNAGNTNTIQTIYFALDKSAPTITISGNSLNWTNVDQIIDLNGIDVVSGIVQKQYSLDGGPWTTYVAPFVISTDLNHTIDFNARNGAGITSGIQRSYAAIDKTPPTYGPIFNVLEWFAAPFYVIFTQIQAGISGLFGIFVSVDNGAYVDANVVYYPVSSQYIIDTFDSNTATNYTQFNYPQWVINNLETGGGIATWNSGNGTLDYSVSASNKSVGYIWNSAAYIDFNADVNIATNSQPSFSQVSFLILTKDGNNGENNVIVLSRHQDGTLAIKKNVNNVESTLYSAASAALDGYTYRASKSGQNWSFWRTTDGITWTNFYSATIADFSADSNWKLALGQQSPSSGTATITFNSISLTNLRYAIDYNDGFEYGNYTTNPVWTIDAGVAGDFNVQTSVVRFGTYAIKITDNGSYPTLKTSIVGTETDFNFYIQGDAGAAPNYTIREDANYANGVFLYLYSGSARYAVCGNGGVPFVASGPNTWYKGEIKLDKVANTASFYLWDSNGTTLVGSAPGISYDCDDTKWDTVRIRSTGGAGSIAYFDDVGYGNQAPYYNAYVLINTDGNHDINLWIRDNAGNDTNIHTNAGLDMNAPTYSSIDNNNVWFNTDFNIVVNDVNYMPSGKLFAKYNINGGAFTDTVASGATENALITNDGNQSIRFWLRDNSGNDRNFLVYALMDKNVPITNITTNGSLTGWVNFVPVDVNLACTDTTAGLCKATSYRINLGPWITTDYNDVNEAPPYDDDDYVTFTLNTDGNNQIDYNSTDLAGSVEPTKTNYIAIDTVPPVILNDHNYNVWMNVDFNVSTDVNFSISGIRLAKYSIDGSAYTDFNFAFNDTNFYVSITTDGNHKLNYWFRNNAGSDTNVIRYAYLDKTGPVLLRDVNFLTWKNVDFNIETDVNFAYSGMLLAKYTIDGSPLYDINYNLNDLNFKVPIVLDGNHTLVYWFRDNAGHDLNFTNFAALDKVLPTITISGNSLNWTTVNQTFDLNGIDLISGIAQKQYSIDGGAWTTYITPYIDQSQIVATLNVGAMQPGNWVAQQFQPSETTLSKITLRGETLSLQNYNVIMTIRDDNFNSPSDIILYTSALYNNDDFNGVNDFNVVFNDNNITFVPGNKYWFVISGTSYSTAIVGASPDTRYPNGLLKINYASAFNPWPVASNADLYFMTWTNNRVTISTDGNHTIDFNARDYANNTSGIFRSYAAIDKTAPTVGPIFNVLQWFVAPFYVIFSQIQASVSGLFAIFVSIDNGAYVPATMTPVIFDENFESGNLISWTNNPNNFGTINAGYLINGQYSLSIESRESSGTFNGWISKPVPHFDSNYYTINYKVKLDGNMDKKAIALALGQYSTTNYFDGNAVFLQIDCVAADTNCSFYTILNNNGSSQGVDIATTILPRNTIYNVTLVVKKYYGVGNLVILNNSTSEVVYSANNIDLFGTKLNLNNFNDFNTVFVYASTNGGAPDRNVFGYFDDISIRLDTNINVLINTDGNHDINIWIRDNAGNDTNIHTYGALDQNGPKYTTIDNNNSVKIADFDIIVNDVNYAYSGKKFAKYSINSDAFIDTVTVGTAEHALVTLDGNNSVRFWLRDNAGNDTNIQVYALLNKNGPRYLFVDGNGLPWKNYVFNITVVDVNFSVSGFRFARYQIDSVSGSWSNMSNVVDSNYFIVINQDANHAVYIWLQDGNGHDTNILVYALSDLIGPEILATFNFGYPWRTADFNVGFDVNFATSGVQLAKYSIDNSPYYDFNIIERFDLGMIDQNQTTTDGYLLIGDKLGVDYQRAQSFIALQQSLTGITLLKGADTSTPIGDITISIQGDNNNKPNGTILSSVFYTHAQWEAMPNIDFNINLPIITTLGNRYWIVLTDNANEAANKSYSFGSNSVGGYPYGNTAYSSNGGATWTMETSDLYFRIYYAYDLNFRIPIVTDGNHLIRAWFRDDANNDTNFIGHANLDKSAPIVGVTTISGGFNVVGTQIWFTGNIIGGAVTDPYSDVNTLSCEYTVTNGAIWLPAVWNTNHCEYIGYTIVAGTTPQFNTRVKDNIGNQGTGTATVMYTADNVKPVTTDNSDTLWHGTTVTILLVPIDIVSGVYSTNYCVDDTNTCNPATIGTTVLYPTPVSVTVTCPTEGVCNRYVRYDSNDLAGNREDTKGSNMIKIDQNRPGVALTTLIGYNVSTTFINNNGNIIGGVATDYNGSGLNTATCEYTINNGGAWGAAVWNVTQCEKTTAVAIVNATIYQFNTRISDNMGNVGAGSATIAYTGDTVAPVTTPSGNTFDHWTTVPQTITLTCSDVPGSGCNSIQYMVDSNGQWFTQNGAAPFVFVLGTDGNHWIDFNSRDNVTNVETTKRTWAAIDVSAPLVGQTYVDTFIMAPPSTQIWGPGHIDATVSDINGIISYCEYTINNGASWLAADKNATHCYKNGIVVTALSHPQYNLRATNMAGLTGAGTATIVYTADTVPPTVLGTTISGFTTYGAGPIYFKGTGTIVGGDANDSFSGLNTSTCQYTPNNGGVWATATWTPIHCQKTAFTGVNGIHYLFNTRITDNGLNTGTGTVSTEYIFDTNGPVTTLTLTQSGPDGNVQLRCIDGGAGCKYIWYNLDNTGWQRTTSPSVDFNWFILAGVGGHQVKYLSTDNLDTNEAQNTVDLNVTGRLRVRIIDENTGFYLSGVIVNFNSINYPVPANGVYDINLYGLTTGLKTVTFSRPLYGAREYDLDMNSAGNYDINMSLITATNGSSIGFTFYKYDGLTAIANGFADLNRPDRNNFSIGRQQLDNLGRGFFYVNNSDQNYTETMTTSTGDVNYAFPVYLTILFPKDEITLLPIDYNWSLLVETEMAFSQQDINTYKNIYLLPNTTNTYNLKIQDMNNFYFPRTYSVSYKGNPLVDTLQPFLISIVDGANTTFVTTNQLGFAIPGVTINVSKIINNTKTLIASGVTDSSGEYVTSLAVTAPYLFDLYINGILISPNNFNLQINESRYYFTINTLSYPIDVNSSYPITVSWDPSGEYRYNATSITERISGLNVNFAKVIVYQYLDSNNTGRINQYAAYYNCPGSCTLSQLISSMPFLDVNLPVYVDVNVYADANLIYERFTKRYSPNATGGVNFMQLFVNAKRSFGCSPTVESICPWTTILTLLLAVIAMGAVMYALKIFNPFAMAIVGAVVVVFFTITGWFFWPLLIPIGLVLIFGLFGRRGSE